jgi:hypothetical protein
MPNPTDIFGNLRWLNKWIKNLLGRVYTLEQGGGSSSVDSEGNLIVADSSSNTVSVAYGDKHDIPNFSGMLIVNDHYDGSVELWICGGGSNAELVSRTNYGPGAGSVDINGAINGYQWTNTSNAEGPFTFTVIKTRSGA